MTGELAELRWVLTLLAPALDAGTWQPIVRGGRLAVLILRDRDQITREECATATRLHCELDAGLLIVL